MKSVADAVAGDEVIVTKNAVGVSERRGEILKVDGPEERRRLTVRWDDGSETIFIPSSGTLVTEGSSSSGAA